MDIRERQVKDTQLEKGYNYEIDNILKDEWHVLLLEFNDATIYQSWSYGEVRWGAERLSHIILKRNDHIVAAAQVRIFRVPLLGETIAYVYRGPLWRLRSEDVNKKNLRQIIKALLIEYVEKRRLFLRVVPNEVSDNRTDVLSVFTSEGFHHSSIAKPYETILIDLSASHDDLYQGLSKKWRENLRRSERSGLTLVEGTSQDLYGVFVDLYIQMHTRKKFVQFVDIHEFKRIHNDLPDNLKLAVLTCERENIPVSTLVYTAIGDTGIPLFSAIGNNGLKLRGSYLLRWTMLQYLKKTGYRFFDQGGINKKNNPGGYHFKSGMGGIEVTFIGEFEKCGSFTKYVIVKAAGILKQYQRRLKVLLRKLTK